MPDALVRTSEAVDRVVEMFRNRLESALRNGQRIRMDAREGTKAQKVSVTTFERHSFAELLQVPEPDGGFELHVYIEPKP